MTPLSREDEETAAAIAYILTRSYDKAADLALLSKTTTYRRVQDYIRRNADTLPEPLRSRLDDALRGTSHGRSKIQAENDNERQSAV